MINSNLEVIESVRAAGAEILSAINDHDWEAVRRICRPDYIHHAPGVPQANLEKYVATLQIAVTAIPDVTIEVQQIIATDEYATLPLHGPWYSSARFSWHSPLGQKHRPAGFGVGAGEGRPARRRLVPIRQRCIARITPLAGGA